MAFIVGIPPQNMHRVLVGGPRTTFKTTVSKLPSAAQPTQSNSRHEEGTPALSHGLSLFSPLVVEQDQSSVSLLASGHLCPGLNVHTYSSRALYLHHIISPAGKCFIIPSHTPFRNLKSTGHIFRGSAVLF